MIVQQLLTLYWLQPDFNTWSSRLHIFGLDLRDLPALEVLEKSIYVITSLVIPTVCRHSVRWLTESTLGWM
jgi:hypothetical protein